MIFCNICFTIDTKTFTHHGSMSDRASNATSSEYPNAPALQIAKNAAANVISGTI